MTKNSTTLDVSAPAEVRSGTGRISSLNKPTVPTRWGDMHLTPEATATIANETKSLVSQVKGLNRKINLRAAEIAKAQASVAESKQTGEILNPVALPMLEEAQANDIATLKIAEGYVAKHRETFNSLPPKMVVAEADKSARTAAHLVKCIDAKTFADKGEFVAPTE